MRSITEINIAYMHVINIAFMHVCTHVLHDDMYR
jgi:hypothetical protein